MKERWVRCDLFFSKFTNFVLLLFYTSFKKAVDMVICITKALVRLIMGCVDHFRIVVHCCSRAGLMGLRILSFFVVPPDPP